MKMKPLRRLQRPTAPAGATHACLGLLLAGLAAGGLLSSCDEPAAKQEAPAPENKEAAPAPVVWPEKPLAEDVETYRAASDKGDHGATCLLARCYINGIGVEKDEQEGFLLLHKAAEAGHAEAQRRLGYCYQEGSGTAVNDEKALKWWRQAEAQGESQALAAIGYCYSTGRGVAKDDQKATEYFRKAAEAGNIIAMSNLGNNYCVGRGVAQDHAEAVKWWKKASGGGNGQSSYNLYVNYSQGKGVEKNEQEALAYLIKAAEQGDVTAQRELSLRYQQGNGVEQNEQKAREWAEKAAAQNDINSLFIMGYYHEYGKGGLTADAAKAAEYYLKAAQQGHADAQLSCANLLLQGPDAEKNTPEAVEWIRKSAAQGNTRAQEILRQIEQAKQLEAAVKAFESHIQRVLNEDYEAQEWLDEATGGNYLVAKHYHAVCCALGIYGARGLPDMESALDGFTEAANAGYADSQLVLGRLCLNGLYMDEDKKAAADWFRKAAEQGNAEAQDALAECYEKGWGLEQNPAEAAAWRQKAENSRKAPGYIKRLDPLAQIGFAPPDNLGIKVTCHYEGASMILRDNDMESEEPARTISAGTDGLIHAENFTLPITRPLEAYNARSSAMGPTIVLYRKLGGNDFELKVLELYIPSRAVAKKVQSVVDELGSTIFNEEGLSEEIGNYIMDHIETIVVHMTSATEGTATAVVSVGDIEASFSGIRVTLGQRGKPVKVEPTRSRR